MGLPTLRYAAMVSTMTFEAAVRAHARFREATGLGGDAGDAILAHLQRTSASDRPFASAARVVLVAAVVSRELLTTVPRLNERDPDLDIRCVRLRPHILDGRSPLSVAASGPAVGVEDVLAPIGLRRPRPRIAFEQSST